MATTRAPVTLLIARDGERVGSRWAGCSFRVGGRRSLLEEQVLVKLALNLHSTLAMGRVGRYRANVMTWVRPSNRKLIDRAIRYTEALLRAEGGPVPPYAELAAACFAALEGLGTTSRSWSRPPTSSARAAELAADHSRRSGRCPGGRRPVAERRDRHAEAARHGEHHFADPVRPGDVAVLDPHTA